MREDKILELTEENEGLKSELFDLRTRIAELEQLADTDTLLPLPNRRAFLRGLDRVIKQVARSHNRAAVLFLDLDGLKAINDDFGHQAGDAVLLHVAEQLGKELRTTDMVARIGGDEFGLILDHMNEADAATKTIAIGNMISAEAVDLGVHKQRISVTIGMTMVRAGDTVQALLDRADAAMYANRLHRSQR